MVVPKAAAAAADGGAAAAQKPKKTEPADDSYELAGGGGGGGNALSNALSMESSKPAPGEMPFEETNQPRVTLAGDITPPKPERSKGKGFGVVVDLPWWSIIAWCVVLSMPIIIGVVWMKTLGLNFKIVAAEPVNAYPALATLKRSGPVGINLGNVDPNKPGRAVKTPFSNWGLSGKLDSRNTVGGSDALMLIDGRSSSPTHIVLRIVVSQGFLDDHNIGGQADVRVNSTHWELQGPNGYKQNPKLLRWRMANPAAINLADSGSIDPAALLPLNCHPTEAKHNKRELLDLPDSGTMTFAGDGCQGQIDYRILRPMGMASAAGFYATGDLKVQTPAGFRVDLTYDGSVMGVRWPNDRHGWWGGDNFLMKRGAFEQSKHELIMMFELPPANSGELTLTCMGDVVASVDPKASYGSVQPEGVSERNAEVTAR